MRGTGGKEEESGTREVTGMEAYGKGRTPVRFGVRMLFVISF